MVGDFNKNDLLITKEVDKETIQVNDIIAWKVNGKIRINKLIKIYNSYEDGSLNYVTKFNKNFHPDNEHPVIDQIIGKVVFKVTGLGVLLIILQSKITTLLVIFILGLYYIYSRNVEVKNRYRARKKRKYEKSIAIFKK